MSKIVFTKFEVDYLNSLDFRSDKSYDIYHQARALGYDSVVAKDMSKAVKVETIAERFGAKIDLNAKPPTITEYTDRYTECVKYFIFAIGRRKLSTILSYSCRITSVIEKTYPIIHTNKVTRDIDLGRLLLVCLSLGYIEEFEYFIKDILHLDSKKIIALSKGLILTLDMDSNSVNYIEENSQNVEYTHKEFNGYLIFCKHDETDLLLDEADLRKFYKSYDK